MFRDRHEAGLLLAERLRHQPRHRGQGRPLVLALPRGGLPVAAPVAEALGADLDVLVVRKVGVPGNPEYAMGAVGEDGVVVIDHAVRERLFLTEEEIRLATRRARDEVARRVHTYRPDARAIRLAGRDVVLVDDGLATGATAAAAVRVARQMGAGRITLAVPVGSREAVARLRSIVDDVFCLEVPEPFWAVGEHYEAFDQLDDAEVVSILDQHRRSTMPDEAARVDHDVRIPIDGTSLSAHLTVPQGASGVIVFAHGAGSGQHSPRNVTVASILQAAGLGTVLVDLVTDTETRSGMDPGVGELARRVVAISSWLAGLPETRALPRGYLGSSSGAAVALAAAADEPTLVDAVVSRGGRPDLAAESLPRVQAPTLLIVGGLDQTVIDVNRRAERLLTCPHLLEVVRGATHLFEEEGTLTQAAAMARAWFLHHLGHRSVANRQRRAS